MSNGETNEISSLYPAAPPYITFFTDENISQLAEYQKSVKKNGNGNGNGNGVDEITCALDYLIPPSMPSGLQYRAFGSVWHVKDHLPDLETMGLTQLYKKPEDATAAGSTSYQYKTQELKKLLKSLLLNYLELVGVLSINPELFQPKVEHIRTILVNTHHLLNEYRPHQSRESLIMLLEEQVEYKKKEIQTINQICAEVRDTLVKIQDSAVETTAD
ncbi:hypothetical protein HG535_0F01970 [Zygotorulaspora mrakii]|uniref:Mediator of RNA polymerase II transcription subunit 7 n=1 Tax=Zygotorulaspora mrakii TaxID=42260 RepID=A0A7H9B5W9_ZYGMR|nr:uncharacterized protein HG535_0F01970 [Zygotorulaspora mrakii]QLG73686.1 hypothetical protein HG535_0F01970 [Zygotorulaspora mrakii]